MLHKNLKRTTNRTTTARATAARTARAIVATLALALALGLAAPAATAKAATFEQVNDESVLIKEPFGGHCVSFSIVMMLRRAALLNGDPAWADITYDSTLVSMGSCPRFSFSTHGISVEHGYASGENRVALLQSLLAEHPAGVVIYEYSGSRMHAVLVLDYIDGVFWACDPLYGDRRPLEECEIVTAENYDAYWVVSSGEKPVEPPVDKDALIATASSQLAGGVTPRTEVA